MQEPNTATPAFDLTPGSPDQLARHGDSGRREQAVRRAKDKVLRLLAAGEPAPQVDSPYLVVPILGQSNAVGDNEVQPDDMSPGTLPVHQWPGCGRRKGQILLATDPLLHEMPARGVGFGRSFGERLAADTGRPVLLVPCGRGDTSFYPKNGYSWDPADTSARVNLFTFAVTQIEGALAAAGPSARVAAFLWHQGESDVPLLAPDAYRARLESVVTGLRSRFGDAPFVLGQMVPEEIESRRAEYAGIDDVHRTLPRTVDSCAFVPGPTGMGKSPTEIIHYSRAGQRELGDRMYAAYAELSSIGESR